MTVDAKLGMGGGNGVQVVDKTNLIMRACNINSQGASALNVSLTTGLTGYTLERSTFTGLTTGITLLGGDKVFVRDCEISASGSNAASGFKINADTMHALRNVTALGCKLSATTAGSGMPARALEVLKAPTSANNKVRFENCEFTATSQNNTVGTPALSGVYAAEANAATLIGGQIVTRALKADGAQLEYAPDVFDLRNAATGGGLGILISGTRYSKWLGPIRSGERRRPVTQTTLNVALAQPTVIRSMAISVPGEAAPQEQPDVYRVLSAIGSGGVTNVDVYIRGTDWAGNRITDKIHLSDGVSVAGVKPFKTVGQIYVTGSGGSVQVGTASTLGLYQPIAAASDVIQQARKPSGATSYTVEAVGTVDATYSTVAVVLAAMGDSLQWTVLASE